MKTTPRLSRAIFLSAVIALIFYWLTCFRTFTWWDSSEYSVAALTLGVPHPPGSLLTVMIGWIATKLPLGIDKLFALNLLTCLMAAITVYLVGLAGLRLFYLTNEANASGPANRFDMAEIGTALGALAAGVSVTMWYYALRFTPYMMTALLTTLIILAMIKWQRRIHEADSHVWLGLTVLLFGLDFSVHRTNLLMLPGLVVWVMLFERNAFSRVRNWIYGIAGFAAGLLVQLALIPMAAAQPFINFNNPNSLSRFWDYITLKQYGGGWLINMFPRKAPLFSVQIADYLKIFGDNFANSYAAPLGWLPLFIGAAGLVIMLRRNWKFGLGLLVLFLLSSFGAVMYFNLPGDFFRSIDRHYMPSFVIFSIFVVYGAAALLRAAFDPARNFRIASAIISLALLVSMPVQSVVRNYRQLDGSKSYFAYDTARNFLTGLPSGAILFTQADIDTYPLWCLQTFERLRQDVTVCNLSLMNTGWFVDEVITRDDKFPLKLSKSELDSLSFIPWKDSIIVLPVKNISEYLGMPADSQLPEFIQLNVTPGYMNKYLMPQDQMLLKILQANDWRRPICFSVMVPEASLRWLLPYLQLEGLHKRFVPVLSENYERDILWRNLIDNYSYRGFTEISITKEDPAKWVGWSLCRLFLTLSSMEYKTGGLPACQKTMDRMLSVISPLELSPPPDLRDAMGNACR